MEMAWRETGVKEGTEMGLKIELYKSPLNGSGQGSSPTPFPALCFDALFNPFFEPGQPLLSPGFPSSVLTVEV